MWYKQFHSLIGKALFHRITSWLRLEGSFEYCLVQPLPAQGSNTSFHSVLRNLPSCHNLSKIIEWLCSDIGHLPQHMWVYPVKSLELCKSCWFWSSLTVLQSRKSIPCSELYHSFHGPGFPECCSYQQRLRQPLSSCILYFFRYTKHAVTIGCFWGLSPKKFSSKGAFTLENAMKPFSKAWRNLRRTMEAASLLSHETHNRLLSCCIAFLCDLSAQKCSGLFSCFILSPLSGAVCCTYPWPGLSLVLRACKILSVTNDCSSGPRKQQGGKMWWNYKSYTRQKKAVFQNGVILLVLLPTKSCTSSALGTLQFPLLCIYPGSFPTLMFYVFFYLFISIIFPFVHLKQWSVPDWWTKSLCCYTKGHVSTIRVGRSGWWLDLLILKNFFNLNNSTPFCMGSCFFSVCLPVAPGELVLAWGSLDLLVFTEHMICQLNFVKNNSKSLTAF